MKFIYRSSRHGGEGVGDETLTAPGYDQPSWLYGGGKPQPPMLQEHKGKVFINSTLILLRDVRVVSLELALDLAEFDARIKFLRQAKQALLDGEFLAQRLAQVEDFPKVFPSLTKTEAEARVAELKRKGPSAHGVAIGQALNR